MVNIKFSQEYASFHKQKSCKKTDIERILKEKQFIRSTQDKRFTYKQPSMPKHTSTRRKSPQQFELQNKAKDFIRKIRNQKYELEGRMLLIKRQESQRKKSKIKKQQIEQCLQKQLQKKIRCLKAQKNVQYFKQKRQLLSQSLSPPHNRRISITTQYQPIQQRQRQILSPNNSQYLQSIQQEDINLPTGFRKKTKTQTRPPQYFEQDEQKPVIGFKLHEVQVYSPKNKKKSRRIKSVQSKLMSNDHRHNYVMKRYPQQNYSQYVRKYTNQVELDSYLKPNKSHSNKQQSARNNYNKKQSERQKFFQNSTHNKFGKNQQFPQIKKKMQRSIIYDNNDSYGNDDDQIIEKTQKNFPILNKIKAKKKRLRTLSTVN